MGPLWQFVHPVLSKRCIPAICATVIAVRSPRIYRSKGELLARRVRSNVARALPIAAGVLILAAESSVEKRAILRYRVQSRDNAVDGLAFLIGIAAHLLE